MGMTKQEILDYFKDINAMYNNPNMLDSLSDMIDELLEEREALKAKDINVPTKWVSVKDRLPTHGEYVLTLDSQGNYYIDQVLRDGRWQETECEWNPVKWWTPLPEPPKEDEA